MAQKIAVVPAVALANDTIAQKSEVLERSIINYHEIRAAMQKVELDVRIARIDLRIAEQTAQLNYLIGKRAAMDYVK